MPGPRVAKIRMARGELAFSVRMFYNMTALKLGGTGLTLVQPKD